MSTDTTWQMHSTGFEDTENLGQKIGRALKGGEVIELVSDLGGGKTTLVRGLARGIGSKDHVASPTFTLMRQYRAKKLTLYHFDLYRLPEAGLMEQELADYIGDPDAVLVVEWGKVLHHVLPDERLRIKLSSTAEKERDITVECPSNYHYITEELNS